MSAANSQALALAAAELRTLCDLTSRLYDLAAQQAAALALLREWGNVPGEEICACAEFNQLERCMHLVQMGLSACGDRLFDLGGVPPSAPLENLREGVAP
jgi:hypothetical protein